MIIFYEMGNLKIVPIFPISVFRSITLAGVVETLWLRNPDIKLKNIEEKQGFVAGFSNIVGKEEFLYPTQIKMLISWWWNIIYSFVKNL